MAAQPLCIVWGLWVYQSSYLLLARVEKVKIRIGFLGANNFITKNSHTPCIPPSNGAQLYVHEQCTQLLHFHYGQIQDIFGLHDLLAFWLLRGNIACDGHSGVTSNTTV